MNRISILRFGLGLGVAAALFYLGCVLMITTAVKVSETLGHVHSWNVELTREASLDEILDAFRGSPRIAFVRTGDGLSAINTIRELTGLEQQAQASWEKTNAALGIGGDFF